MMAAAEDPPRENGSTRSADELRRHAEELIDGLADPEADATWAEDPAATLHELRVHQIELEMQGEELREAQLALEEQRLKYFDLFDRAPVGYLTISGTGIVTNANLTATRLLGAQRQALVGTSFSAFVFAADRNLYYEHLKLLEQSEEPQPVELRLQPLGTEPFWARLEDRPQRDARGELLHYRLTFGDISDRVQATEALRDSEEGYSALIGQSSEGIAVTEADGIVFIWNDSMVSLTGIQEREAVGRPIWEVQWRQIPEEQKTPELLEQLQAGFKRAAGSAADRQGGSREQEIVRTDGTRRVVQDSSFLVRTAHAVRFCSVLRDITESEQAADALRESEARYRSLFEDNHAVMLLIDPASGAVVDANPAACAWYGWDREEMLTMRIDQINTLSSAEIRAEMALASTKKRRVFDFRHRLADGTIRDVEVYSGPIEVRGRALLYSLVQDVTERKQAERELRASEERLRQLFESAHDFIWEVDESGAYTFLSQQVRDILGYEPEEMIGKTSYDFVSPGEAAIVASDFASVVDDARAFSGMVTQSRHKDGHLVVLETNGTPTIGASGAPLGWRGTSRDITERTKSQQDLRDGAERYKTILQTAMDGFALVDMQGRVLEANEAYASMCGYSAEELLDMRIADLVPSSNAGDIADHMRTILADGGDRFESRHLHKDGSAFDIELSVRYRSVDGGQMAAFIRDITERKQAERLLVLQSEVLNNLARRPSTQGAVRGIVEAVQRATGLDAVGLRLPEDDDYPFFASVGYTDEFLKTENALAVSYPDGGLCRNDDGSVMLECTCGLVLRGDFEPTDPLFTPGGSVWTNDSAHMPEPEHDPRLNPRNKCVHVGFQSIALIPLRAGDEVFGLLHLADRRKDRFTPDSIRFFEGVCSSVGTVLRRMHAEEEILRQKDALKQLNESLEERIAERTLELSLAVDDANEANEAKTLFLRSMSHELRTPLNSVIGFSSLLADGIPGEVNEEQARQLAMINNSGQHLLSLINDILDLSRIEAGAVEIDVGPVDVSALVAGVTAECAPLAEAKGLTLAVEVGEPAPTLVSDTRQIRQILLNLMGNAVKFTEAGEIVLRISRPSRGLVSFSVSDTGHGIPIEDRAHIFGEFERGASQTPDVEGTGLGLAISRGLAGSLGGSLELASEVGKGSTFTLTLPEKLDPPERRQL